MNPAKEVECCGGGCVPIGEAPRPELIKRALVLAYLTIGWNVVEGMVAVTAAMAAGSVALLGFGIDSFVECSSALVMAWRLRAEVQHRCTDAALDAIELRARHLIALSLFALAVYVTLDAGHALWRQERPEFSLVGSLVLSISIGVMLWLARAKRTLATSLKSEAMEADAFQTTACWWLSLAALGGVGLNVLFGWWWADPVAALVIAFLVAQRGSGRPPSTAYFERYVNWASPTLPGSIWISFVPTIRSLPRTCETRSCASPTRPSKGSSSRVNASSTSLLCASSPPADG